MISSAPRRAPRVQVYNATVSGMTGSGSVRLSVPAAATADVCGNLNLASTSSGGNSVAYDVTAPALLVLARAATQVATVSSVAAALLIRLRSPRRR